MPVENSRSITPWYDSKAVCAVGLILMAVVFFFALIGLSVAYEKAEFRKHLFIPLSLIGLSLGELAVLTLRLARHSIRKRASS